MIDRAGGEPPSPSPSPPRGRGRGRAPRDRLSSHGHASRLTVTLDDVRSVLRSFSASVSADERRRLEASYAAFRGESADGSVARGRVALA